MQTQLFVILSDPLRQRLRGESEEFLLLVMPLGFFASLRMTIPGISATRCTTMLAPSTKALVIRMSEDQLYENIPTDPEQAFLYLEKYYRAERDENSAQLIRSNEPEHSAYVTYLTKMNAAISELGLESELSFGLPNVQNIDFDTYQNLFNNINTYLTKLKIRHGRRVQGYSVRFDAVTKMKIRHHLSQVRGIVDILDVDQRKKEALFKKISALELEVERDRTRFETYGAFIICAAEVLGDAADKSEPARKWVDSISRLFWGAKNEEEAKQLPSPPERKQIESLRHEDSFGDFNDADGNNPPDFDDKVPF